MKNIGNSKYISSQNGELSTGAERLPEVNLFYFEGASIDARDNKQFSEDFLTYQYKDNSLYFIVCDGVQQSIDASLAARFFGMDLVEILPLVQGNKKLIETHAQKLRSSIDEKVSSMPFDENDPMYDFHIRA